VATPNALNPTATPSIFAHVTVRRWQAIEYTRVQPKRVPLYRALIKIVRMSLTYLRDGAARLSGSAAAVVVL